MSKEFNTVVTPHAYEWVDISDDGLLERLMDGSGEQCLKFLGNIRRYTQRLEVTAKPIEEFYKFTASLVEECQLLSHITYKLLPYPNTFISLILVVWMFFADGGTAGILPIMASQEATYQELNCQGWHRCTLTRIRTGKAIHLS